MNPQDFDETTPDDEEPLGWFLSCLRRLDREPENWEDTTGENNE